MKIRPVLVGVFCLLNVTSASAQSIIPAFVPQRQTENFASHELDSIPPPSTQASSVQAQVNWSRVGITAGSLAVAITALHIYQLNAWWATDRGPFHVIEDDGYQVDFDKAGHMFGAYYSSYFFDQAYRWAGLDTAQSALFGALSGALWEYYVETEDGFASQWGFSRGDAKADLVGASFYLLNQRMPLLKYFRYKWSYFPSYKYLHNQPDIPGQTLNFIEDYTGQSYWMSVDVHSILRDVGAGTFWPAWLNIAVGVSGSELGPIDLNSPTGNIYDQRHLAWLISLDYDLGTLIPESSSGLLNFVRRALNYWHFPAPAWEISPQHKFFVLFPLQMTIG